MKLIKVLLLDGVTTYSTIREFLKVAKEGDLFICGNLDTEIKPENVKIFIRYDKGRETVSYVANPYRYNKEIVSFLPVIFVENLYHRSLKSNNF